METKQVEELLKAISPGKWISKLTPYGFCILAGDESLAIAERYFDRDPSDIELKVLHANADFISHSKTIVSELLGEVKRLEKKMREKDKAIGLARSMILGGESMTDTAEAFLASALATNPSIDNQENSNE